MADVATAHPLADTIADNLERLFERHRPTAVGIRDGQLHLTFALHGEPGEPTSDDLLRLLMVQTATHSVRRDRQRG